jgi:hypothetical protein
VYSERLALYELHPSAWPWTRGRGRVAAGIAALSESPRRFRSELSRRVESSWSSGCPDRGGAANKVGNRPSREPAGAIIVFAGALTDSAGGIIASGGVTIAPRGAMIVSAGGIVVSRGAMIATGGARIVSEGAVIVSGGAVIVAQGRIIVSRGAFFDPRGAKKKATGPKVSWRGSVLVPPGA